MTVSLPESVAEVVRERIAAGRYSSPEEYIASLILDDREEARLEELLLQGLHSGSSVKADPAFWDALRRRADGS